MTAFVSTVLVLATVFVALSQVVSYSFEKLERQQAAKSVSHVIASLADMQSNLKSSVMDWGYWDETYDFVVNHTPQYAEKNLDGNSIRNLRIHSLIITNINKEILSTTSVDTKSGRVYQTPFAATQRCLTLLDNFKTNRADEMVTGIVMQRDGPEIIAAGKVVRSDRSGPVAGYIIMTREITGADLASIGHSMNLAIDLYAIPSEKATSEIAKTKGKNINEPWIKVVSKQILVGYAIISSYPPHTQVLIRCEQPREISYYAQLNLGWMITITICVGLLLVIIQMRMMNRFIGKRIDDLGHRIVDIAHKQDTNGRLPVQGHDEITRVSQAVNWMLDTLQYSNQELREANSEQQDLIRIISHDLKTPLRSIGSLAGMLGQDIQEHLDDDNRWMLDTMVARMQKAYSLIDAVVDYQQAGTPPGSLDDVNLKPLLDDLLQIAPPPNGVEVVVPDTLPVIKANHSRIVTVFRNLLTDSYASVPSPGGKIEFSSVSQGDHHVITLHNNAEALAPQYHRMVFEVMRRFQTETSDEVLPNMLLPTVRRIIEAHGGHVWLDSAEGVGRSFHISIPA